MKLFNDFHENRSKIDQMMALISLNQTDRLELLEKGTSQVRRDAPQQGAGPNGVLLAGTVRVEACGGPGAMHTEGCFGSARALGFLSPLVLMSALPRSGDPSQASIH